jgi:hypothetical protein
MMAQQAQAQAQQQQMLMLAQQQQQQQQQQMLMQMQLGAAAGLGVGLGIGAGAGAGGAAAFGAPAGAPSRVCCLEGMVTQAELADDAEYRDIVADITEEGAKFGALQIQVPRPPLPGAGRVFLHYAALADAVRAATELHGRKFGDSRVRVTYYDEATFGAGRLDA